MVYKKTPDRHFTGNFIYFGPSTILFTGVVVTCDLSITYLYIYYLSIGKLRMHTKLT